MGHTKICRFCGNVLDINDKKCRYCKKELNVEDTPDMYCKKCKAPVNIDDYFCQKCGAIFNIPEEIVPEKHNAIGIPYHIGILLTSLAVSFAITIFVTSGKETAILENIIFYSITFIAAEAALYIYFLPSIIAIENNHPNTFLIYLFNLLTGITVAGWFITLFFAIKSNEES